MEEQKEEKTVAKEIAVSEIKKMSIYEKMQKITEEMGVIQKNLSIQAGSNKYKAVSERDILDNVKPLEAKYRIYSYPFERNILQSDILVKETEYQGKATKTNSLFMRIEAIYRFVNIDMPEQYIDIKSYADGIDTGDKAAGKAMTYADKYALMKAYKISTGDDPDKDPSPENGYQKSKQQIIYATQKQVEILSNIYTGDNLTKLLEANSIKSIDELTSSKASELISKCFEAKKNKTKEKEEK